MQTLGIDLSTDPKKVWTCEIDWGQSPPVITSLVRMADMRDPRSVAAAPVGADDSATAPPGRASPVPIRDEAGLIAGLVERIVAFDPAPGRVIGVDAPLGWPSAFVDAISDWDDGDPQGFRKRPELRLRATDRFVHAVTRAMPMSVSADRMGSTAMLLAEVLSRSCRRLDRPGFDRSSAAGGLAEVSPTAALRAWLVDGYPLRTGPYKSSPVARETILHTLVLSGFELSPEQAMAMYRSDDALDAFLCALVARGVAVGECLTVADPIDVQQLLPRTGGGGPETIEELTDRLDLARALQDEAARTAPTEGWIHVPARQELAVALGTTPGSATPLGPIGPPPMAMLVGWSPAEPWPDEDGDPFDEDGVRIASPTDDDWRARL